MATEFGIGYSRWNARLLGLLGMGAGSSGIEVDDTTVSVRMGWAFRTSFDRSAVEFAAADDDRVWGWGVHGWRDHWLVNGTSKGLVRITLESAVPARICFVPWRVRVLRVSVTDRDAFLAQLRMR